MTDIAARVRRFVDRHQLWLVGGRVLAAVSGGSDSVSLLWILRELQDAGAVTLTGVAHLNHQLRAHADRDEEFCRALAERLAVPLVVGRVDVAALARAGRCSIEVAARRTRYEFLEEMRVATSSDHVAVAHTRDDQAETVLMRLVRGAGTRGLRGVLPVRGAVVRPLLDCGRDELRQFLAARSQTWVEDETNADLRHPRNRIRHELLPMLASRYRPSVDRVLARTADVAAHDDALLEHLAGHALAPLLTRAATTVQLDAAGLRALPLALRRRAARQVLLLAGARRSPGHADIERLLDVCSTAGPAACQCTGLRVERFSLDAVLLRRDGALGAAAALLEQVLLVPGSAALAQLGPGCRVEAFGPITREGGSGPSLYQVAVRADAVTLPLLVRGRRSGDRIRPVGLGGTKTLQDLLVDRKVPRAERHRTPVVADANGEIVWVVGHAVAAHTASSPQDDVIVLTFVQPAVPGSEAS